MNKNAYSTIGLSARRSAQMGINVRIAYCEDEIAQARLVRRMVEAWAEREKQELQLDTFHSAENFLFEMNGASLMPYDLILLDISMSGMDGYALARKLREKDGLVRIAFLTSDSSHVFDGYELHAWRYIMKPMDQECVAGMLDALCKELSVKNGQSILLEITGEKVRIDLEQILYLEVNGHYTTLHCIDQELGGEQHQEYTIKESFVELLSRLNEDHVTFIKCHRSIAVHVSKLQKISRQSCILTGGIELPVSRGMYQELNQAFIRENL